MTTVRPDLLPETGKQKTEGGINGWDAANGHARNAGQRMTPGRNATAGRARMPGGGPGTTGYGNSSPVTVMAEGGTKK